MNKFFLIAILFCSCGVKQMTIKKSQDTPKNIAELKQNVLDRNNYFNYEWLNIYGKTKLASEHILLEKDIKNLVIRGNVLYDYSPHTSASFLNWVVSSLKGNQEIKVVEDQFNNPTWTRSMSDIIELSIENELEGIIHWGDSEHISRFEFAKLIAKKFSLNESLIKPVSTSELNQPARRPLQSGLSPEKLVNMLNIIPPSIDDCLDEIIKTIQ